VYRLRWSPNSGKLSLACRRAAGTWLRSRTQIPAWSLCLRTTPFRGHLRTAAEELMTIRAWGRSIARNSERELEAQVVSRAGEIVSKLATIRALSTSPAEPAVALEDVRWGARHCADIPCHDPPGRGSAYVGQRFRGADQAHPRTRPKGRVEWPQALRSASEAGRLTSPARSVAW
jgi:hypothetical protein